MAKKQHKKRGGEEEVEHPHVHDESNWLISYADMMTLLFGFFVLMYSMSKTDKEKFEVFSQQIGKHFGGQVKGDHAGIYAANALIEKTEDEIKKAISKFGVEDFVQMKLGEKNIELSFDGSILFRSGSAELIPKMYPLMTEIVSLVKQQLNVQMVTVEGHTDDIPIRSPVFPTNWELSAARAARVVRHFVSVGFPKENLIAQGLGDSRPLHPNRDEMGNPIADNLAKNRRVVVNVEFDGANKKMLEKFKRREASESVYNQQAEEEIDESEQLPDPSIDPNLSPEERIKAAQEKLKKAKEIMKQKKAEKQILQKQMALEKKLKETIQNTEQLKEDIQDIKGIKKDKNRQPSSDKWRLPNSGKTLSREQGVQALKNRIKYQKRAPQNQQRAPQNQQRAPQNQQRAPQNQQPARRPTTPRTAPTAQRKTQNRQRKPQAVKTKEEQLPTQLPPKVSN